MSTNKTGTGMSRVWTLICDGCCQYEAFGDLMDLVAFKKAQGWASRRIDFEWRDYCADCKDLSFEEE